MQEDLYGEQNNGVHEVEISPRNNYGKVEIEMPVVSVDDFWNNEKVLIIHSHINNKGKMILSKEEAELLLIELYKFVKS